MATYSISLSELNHNGQFQDEKRARDEFNVLAAAGVFVRLVKWENEHAIELARANEVQKGHDTHVM